MARKTDSFAGFPAEARWFLEEIEANNNREWFEANKPLYLEKVKQPMEELVAAIGREMGDYAADYIPEPKKAVLRIYRDVRFSKNKLPYKTNVAANFPRQGQGKMEGASFYLHLDRKELVVAAGIYMPSPETLKQLRSYIAGRHEELRAIIAERNLKKLMGGLHGEPMTRLPKGYLPGDPAEDLLRYKMFIVWSELDPALAYSSKVVTEVSKRFRAAAPLVEFLNRGLAPRKNLAFLL